MMVLHTICRLNYVVKCTIFITFIFLYSAHIHFFLLNNIIVINVIYHALAIMAQQYLYIVAKEIGVNNDHYGDNYHICATNSTDCFNQICKQRWGSKKYAHCPAYVVYHEKLRNITHHENGKKKDSINIKNHPSWKLEIQQNIAVCAHPFKLGKQDSHAPKLYIVKGLDIEVVLSSTDAQTNTQPYYVIAHNTEDCFQYICMYVWASPSYKQTTAYISLTKKCPNLDWDQSIKDAITTSTQYTLHEDNHWQPGIQFLYF